MLDVFALCRQHLQQKDEEMADMDEEVVNVLLRQAGVQDVNRACNDAYAMVQSNGQLWPTAEQLPDALCALEHLAVSVSSPIVDRVALEIICDSAGGS